MKAVLLKKYGSPKQVLAITEIAKQVPRANEVLIKIKTTTINDYDWCVARGKPYVYRIIFGLTRPKNKIPGMELAGIVEEVGAEVQILKTGVEVYGDISNFGLGSFAEYICINEKAVIKKPPALSFEQAAALPHASLLAFQALEGIGKISHGQKVLINGGGGGVGTIGLQLAKLHNCEVTGVDTGEKLTMMQAIGYDFVIDYQKTDFTKSGPDRNRVLYDLILDCKTNRSPFSYARSLTPNGTYVTIGGKPGSLINVLLFGKLIALFSKKKLKVLSLRSNVGLEQMGELCMHHKINCRIDGPYSMNDIPELIQYFGEGKHKGKIVIKIN